MSRASIALAIVALALVVAGPPVMFHFLVDRSWSPNELSDWLACTVIVELTGVALSREARRRVGAVKDDGFPRRAALVVANAAFGLGLTLGVLVFLGAILFFAVSLSLGMA